MCLPSNFIAGLDEVGRGSLFGPVYAGAVVLSDVNKEFLFQSGLKDSKKLSKKKISELSALVLNNSIDWGIGFSSAQEIDHMGIRDATEYAMIRALNRLNHLPKLILVDGILKIKKWSGPQRTIVKGDSKELSISAASVLAKNARDNILINLSKDYPEYGLEKNVGYGTKYHREAIIKFGPSIEHRKTFLKKIHKNY